MNLQTKWMRETDEREVYAIKNDDGTFSGIEYVNHPTPSGCPRYLPTLSDNRHWPDEATALAEFQKVLDKIDEKRAEKKA